MFHVVAIDPPWPYKDKLPGTRGAESHYPVMSMDQLYKLELPPVADDAVMFMWRVASMQNEALTLMHMLGFEPKTEMVWVKTKNGVVEEPASETDLAFGMGRSVRAAHEVCLIGTRGKYSKLIQDHSVRSVFFAERGCHSQKPERFYDLVEKMCVGPYLDVFARRHREGWTCIGDELGTKL